MNQKFSKNVYRGITSGFLSMLLVLTSIFTSLTSANAAGELNSSVTVSTNGGFSAAYGSPNPQPITVSFIAVNGVNGVANQSLTFTISDAVVVGTTCSFTASCVGISASYVSNGITTNLTSTPPSFGIRFVNGAGKVDLRFDPNEVIPAGANVTMTIGTGRIQIANNSILLGASSGLIDTQTNNVALVDPPVVTFNSNFGSTPTTSTQTASNNAQVPLNGSFSRAGYTLAGWTTNADGTGTSYSPTQTYTFSAAATLYAKWTANTNVVTYNVDGGSSVSNGSFATGGTLTLPASPTKSGYSFAGWFENASGGSALPSVYNPSATGAITLYARWTPLSRTVTFDANGGSGSMTSQVSSSSALLSLNTISRSGFGFTGWNTAANGSGTTYAVDAIHPFTTSETLYAQWRILPATPVAEVVIQIPVGAAIANAPVDLDIDGLKDQTGYTVTVYSTPQIIDQGTIWSGRLNTTVRIPSNLEPGWHRLVIEGTAADGTPWTEEKFFEVSPGGILLATSEIVPAELAMTGSNSVPVFYGAGALIILGVGFLLTNTTLRRRVKQMPMKQV